MARQLAKLSPRGAETLKTPGRHSDGGGLYLVVEPTGSKRWAFMYRWREPGATGAGKLREMGLGSFSSVPLAKARKKAAEAREQLADRIDPIAARRELKDIPTFGAVADEVVTLRSAEMRNAKAIYRLKRALEVHALDLRPKRVDVVSTADVVAILRPMWMKTPDAASKVRGYIEMVLDFAQAKGHRTGENPARWKGHLDHLLQKQPKLVRGHHTALPFAELPALMAELRSRDAVSARGLEFAILTASRSGEVFGAVWSEFDLDAKLWTIPAVRMKNLADHRVPLCARAVEILREMEKLRPGTDDGPVFPGQKEGRGLSGMAFLMLMRRMGREGLTTHGFRSSFRDWCGECTNFPRDVAEVALSHTIGDDVERAYRRGDALLKRRKMMDAWGSYCSRPMVGGDNVSSMGPLAVGAPTDGASTPAGRAAPTPAAPTPL